MYHFGVLIVLLYHSLDAVGSVSQAEIERHLELGRDFLAKRQLQDALTHYHAAVDGDRNNYLTYYKRGTVYLGLGKAKLALLDFSKVLELKPDFTAARVQRGTIFLKQAEFDQAESDALDVLAVEPHNAEAESTYKKIQPTRDSYRLAQSLVQQERYDEAVDLLSDIIEVCPWSPFLRELRAEANAAAGDYMNAISDIRSTTKLLSDNTQGFYKLSAMLYRIGHVDDSLKEIRECLKLDPEHKECFPFYKKVKIIAKKLNDAKEANESSDTEGCVAAANYILKTEKKHEKVRFLAYQWLCKCYRNDEDASLAVSNCKEALEINRDAEILCDSVEAYLNAEMFDDAIREAKEAQQMDPSSERAKELHQRALQQQKVSESRDYYKILHVPRTATKREIIKAYRKEAQKWHPDNFQEGEAKKRAEKKFINIAAAKEVLTDEDKRARFDRGEDPLDPESGMHSGPKFRDFHQFHGGGSPFQFKFHFN
ncbi:dnaJ homolog subfamily C member 3 [Venturia canescens]|uniref:dnaJ homolog subfamily C member 3 n=1 Tax=Venturia canescens TaxID=32260 RepID=UPI001C9D3281|nr:dnaJ homolog subfamily C member 3 [Venturia canescens]